MPRLLGILNEHGVVKGDSERAAAVTCTSMLHEPRKLGRSIERRQERMHSTIGVAIKEGFVVYSTADGLRLTAKGLDFLTARRRNRQPARKPDGRAHGRRSPVPAI